MARILALDYGTKRIGIALSDETRLIASAHGAIANDDKTMATLKTLIAAYNVDALLLGKPLHGNPPPANGFENSFLPRVEAFANRLCKEFGLPLYFHDESLSSKSSRAFLISTGKRGKKLKEKLDSAAAQSFLAEFLLLLEKQSPEPHKPPPPPH